LNIISAVADTFWRVVWRRWFIISISVVKLAVQMRSSRRAKMVHDYFVEMGLMLTLRSWIVQYWGQHCVC